MTDPADRSALPSMRLMGVHSGALGDVILFAQALNALRAPGQRVALVAGGEKTRMLAELGAIDEPLDFNSLPMEDLFAQRPVESCTLPARLGPAEWLVSCLGEGDPAAESRLAACCGARWARFLPIRPPAGEQRHLLDVWAERLGLPAIVVPPWSATQAMRMQAERALALAGADPLGPFVAMHPGSGSPAKCWPVAGYEELARRLDLPTVLLLGPCEQERWGAKELEELKRRWAVLVCPSLVTLAGVLALAAGFVGNDSGPSHLAASLGTPTIALFGPTQSAHFAPRGPRVRTISHQPLADLPAETVLAALNQLLGL